MQIFNLVDSHEKKTVYFYSKNATFHADGLKTADEIDLTNARWFAVKRDTNIKTKNKK